MTKIQEQMNTSPYLFILVLEILLQRILLDDNVTKIKLSNPGHRDEDGGATNIPVLQCFADDMTCVIEETERNLLMMKNIFESFAELSGLEINEGKTKVIRIGDKLDNIIPLTNKVKFKYEKYFKLLGVNIDNKLEKRAENFEKKEKQDKASYYLLDFTSTRDKLSLKFRAEDAEIYIDWS